MKKFKIAFGMFLLSVVTVPLASAFWGSWGDNDEVELTPTDFYNQSVIGENNALGAYTDMIKARLIAERNLAISKKNSTDDGDEVVRYGKKMDELKTQIEGMSNGTFLPVCVNQWVESPEQGDDKDAEIQRLKQENERLKLGL